MIPLPQALLVRFAPAHRAAAAVVSELPAYQVALWPDGWDLQPDGGVMVRDTHAMAEARRWYRLAERNHSREDARRVMSLHGVFVPPAIVDMADRRFVSEQVASVAVQLVAGDWIKQRRRRMLDSPEDALAERSISWCGSRSACDLEETDMSGLLRRLVRLCVDERLIPDADYRPCVRRDDGYGIRSYHCTLEVLLDRYVRDRVGDVLRTALIPWNRSVVRGGEPSVVIGLEVVGGRRIVK
ncbi:MAG: hypothetical protein U9Q81_14735 [Pseudomonadota bacterium]|nr:hypothetical protein [Pseudomonadota bacterium]